jgi:catechol 2,3-dioxygenase-like lactoylglutathione lyase family enzyme
MGNPKLKVTGINHVVLHVANLDRSRTFYTGILGFEHRGTMSDGPGGMEASFLRCGIQGLDLFELAGRDVHGGEEMNHMALGSRDRHIRDDTSQFGVHLRPGRPQDRDAPYQCR